jgi:hypothetical protein
VVYVCRGSACRKPPERGDVIACLDRVAIVCSVKCQGICKGVVIGTDVDGRREWFARVRRPKTVRALVRWLRRRGPIPGRVERRRLPKRSGRRPKGGAFA